MAQGVTIHGRVYRWSQEVSLEAIERRTAQEKAATGVTVVLAFAAALVLLLAIFLAFLTHQLLALFSMRFWITPSATAFCFVVAAGLGVLLFSHRLRSHKHPATMPALVLHDVPPPVLETDATKHEVNIADLFDGSTLDAVNAAFSLATKFGHHEVEPIHLFIAALDDVNVGAVFSRLGLSFATMQEALGRRLSSRQLGSTVVFSEAAEAVLLTAFVNAFWQQRLSVAALEVFFESYQREPFIQEVLLDQGVTQKQFANMVEWVRIHEKMRERYEQFHKAAVFKPTGPMNRAMTSVATPFLDACSEDLTALGVRGGLPLLIGRDREIESLFRVMEGGRQSVLLVGPEGVGKTALLSGIAQLMIEERVPDLLQDKRLVRLSIPHVLSGASTVEAEERLMMILHEVSRAGNIVLAIIDVEQLVAASSGGEGADLSATLVDFLSRSATFAIATTTPRAYSSVVESSLLNRVFQKVDVREPDEQEAIHILESKVGAIEYEQGVVFSYAALETCVQLTDRYMHERFLPQKAIEIARETALFVAKTKGKDALVTDQDIAHIVAEKTNVPLTNLQQDERDTLIHLEERMHERMIGQEEAVSAVAAALRRARTNLQSTSRPIATFLFLGPTGVGKTELAKTIAETYFGSEQAMVRLDMSEYQDASSLQRLIGDPATERPGWLTEAVRKNPFSIVLLDEFEKADQQILNVFLQVFDDGRLTDATGRTVDFTNTVIIATSNAGSRYIQDAVARGMNRAALKTALMEEQLRDVYRPELLNRFDGVIVFAPLTEPELALIARLLIAEVAKRLEPKGILLRVSDGVIKQLVEKGYDPTYGARPLRRVIQEEVDNAIASVLLEGTIKRRDTIVLDENGIHIEEGERL